MGFKTLVNKILDLIKSTKIEHCIEIVGRQIVYKPGSVI